MNKVLLLSGLALALIACGGGGGGGGTTFVDPHSVSFQYNAYSSTSTVDGPQTAADAGATGADDVVALTAASDEPAAESLANLPDTMGNAVFKSMVPAAAQVQAAQARSAFQARAAAYAAGNVAAATQGFDPACMDIQPTSITYKGCTYTQTDVNGTAIVTLNGSITRGLTSVTWSVTLGMDMTVYDSGGDISMSISQHLEGDIAVTELAADSWGIQGEALSQWAASAHGQGQSVSFAFSHWVGIDLVYQPSIACLVDGTVELKRVWTTRPQGYTATDLPNVGVKFDWNGCQVVQVSWGVQQ